ncbi:MAG: hypothetical protein Q9162_006901 [Coniocarpon cinnabarinum]
MALSSEQVNALVELHRRNATLEAEVSHLQLQNKQLTSVNTYLVQQLAFHYSSDKQLPLLEHEHGTVPPQSGGVSCLEANLPGPVSRPSSEKEDQRQHTTPSGVAPPDLQQTTPELDSSGHDNNGSRNADDPSYPNDPKVRAIYDNPDAPRFSPRDISGHLRTVIVTELPATVTLKELAGKVCGGLVVSMVLLDTKSTCGSVSAMVQFFEETAARDFVKHCLREPLTFMSSSARVSLLHTPTIPVSTLTYGNIVNHGATRRLVVKSCPPRLSIHYICTKLSPHDHPGMHGILEVFENAQRFIYITFNSIDKATFARDRLNRFSVFRPAQAHFQKDPCDTPCTALSPRETSATASIGLEHPKALQAPPRQPRTMRVSTPQGLRVYSDWDAPTLPQTAQELNYDEVVGAAPPSQMFRRAKPLDYSEQHSAPAPVPKLIPDLLEDDVPMSAGDTTVTKAQKAPSLSKDSSTGDGELLEREIQEVSHALSKTTIHEPKAANSASKSLSGSSQVLPVTNRHLGPPSQAPSVKTDSNATSDRQIESRLERKDSSSSSTASSTDSAEIERARNRRELDKVLATTQASENAQKLDYD